MEGKEHASQGERKMEEGVEAELSDKAQGGRGREDGRGGEGVRGGRRNQG